MDSMLGALVRLPKQREAQDEKRETISRPVSRRALAALPVVVMLLDAVCLCVAVAVAAVGRNHIGVLGHTGTDFDPNLVTAAPCVIFGWLLVTHFCGGYDETAFGAGT